MILHLPVMTDLEMCVEIFLFLFHVGRWIVVKCLVNYYVMVQFLILVLGKKKTL